MVRSCPQSVVSSCPKHVAMDVINEFLKAKLPAYLAHLPLPATFSGFLELSMDDAATLLPLFTFLFCLFFFPLLSMPPRPKPARV